MRPQESRHCLTSNCTKLTTHESGICHLHRKRRINAKGELEWCFPANCYFKTDSKKTRTNFSNLPKVNIKQKKTPIKSFADLHILLERLPNHEQQAGKEYTRQCAAKLPNSNPSEKVPDENTTKDASGKPEMGFWRRLVRVFSISNSSAV